MIFIQDQNSNIRILKERKNQWVKISVRAPLGIKSPLGTESGGNFFPATGMGGGDGSGDGDWEYALCSRLTPLASLLVQEE